MNHRHARHTSLFLTLLPCSHDDRGQRFLSVLADLLSGGDQNKLEATAALSLMAFLVHSLVEPSCLWTPGPIVAGIDAEIPKVGQGRL